MKRIILLGATGSIGRSACDVVRAHPERFKVVALAVRENLAAAALLGREFGAKVYDFKWTGDFSEARNYSFFFFFCD